MTPFCLYELIHIRAGHPRLVAQHATALGAASQLLFGRPYAPNIRQLTARIATLAQRERYPADLSGFIRLELTPEGEERLTPAGISLYEGYALRTLMPDAATIDYSLPQLSAHSSAHEAATTLANHYVHSSGAEIAVRCNTQGLIIEADNAPLFAIRGREILTSAAPLTPMQELVLRAAPKADLRLGSTPPTKHELATFDELFYADHRGITALARCDGYPFMSLCAERIAAAMEQLFD